MKQLYHDLEDLTGEQLIGLRNATGGCVSESYFMRTHEGNSYFIKVDNSQRGLLDSEAYGLELLRQSESFRIPKVIRATKQYLILEAIIHARPKRDFWQKFGENLAKLHRFHGSQWGLDQDNFCGLTPQLNQFSGTSWADFFISNRLRPQLNWLEQKGLHSDLLHQQQERLLQHIHDQLSRIEEPNPSLLHGDLWSGNYLASGHNEPVLIDPAVYFGHREAEFSIMKLFGGFPDEMYQSYERLYPFEEGHEHRLKIYTLYHLLNHANLFGESYLTQGESCALEILRGA